VPKPNPGNTGDDKNKHGIHEINSSDPQQFYHASYAYVHVELGFPDLLGNLYCLVKF
jgi:hypothetical protein